MGHAKNSPSVFFRRRLCPGSARLEAQFPDTDNEYSLRGTAAHKVGELCLLEGKTPGYWLDQPISVQKADGTTHIHKFNQEDNEAVWAYINYVYTRKDQMGDGVQLLIEEKSDPGIWEGRNDVAGTLDCALIGRNEIEIIDYKHGSGHAVDPEFNPQMSQYAIGILATLDWNQVPHDIPVRCTIVQPRCPHPDGPVRTWDLVNGVPLTAQYFFTLTATYKAAAEATDDPEAPLVPGEDQCRFCKAKGACPAVASASLQAFKDTTQAYIQQRTEIVVTEDAGKPTSREQVETTLGQPVEVLSEQAIATILDKAPMIKSWLDGVLKHATELALDGKPIPGYKLVRGRSNRKWDLEDDAMITKLAGLRDREKKAIGKEAACTIKPLSVAQAEKSIKPRVSDRVWKNLEKVIIKPEGAPTLVPLTDPRAPLQTAETAFQPVVEKAPKVIENPFG